MWDENYYKFQHFLMHRTNCLFIIHNKKTFYYRTLSCEMWILVLKFFFSNIEWNGTEWNVEWEKTHGMEWNLLKVCGMEWSRIFMEWKWNSNFQDFRPLIANLKLENK